MRRSRSSTAICVCSGTDVVGGEDSILLNAKRQTRNAKGREKEKGESRKDIGAVVGDSGNPPALWLFIRQAGDSRTPAASSNSVARNATGEATTNRLARASLAVVILRESSGQDLIGRGRFELRQNDSSTPQAHRRLLINDF